MPPDSDSSSSTISNESLHVSDNSLENNNDLSDNILITDTNPFSNEICEGKLDASPTNTFCNIFEKNVADVNARPSLLSDLITWFYDKKVNHEQLTGILQVLNKHGHPDLPSCSKTALKTVRKLPYIEVVSTKNTPAQFIYFGIKQNLEIEFKRGLSSILKESTIQLVCNVDGLSIFTSSVWQFWPLLGQIFVKNCHTEPFVIALYYGDSKPADLETYFQEFIEEINVLQTTGFTYEETNFKFQLKYFICDSPARAFLKCIKSHNGFFSCDKCNVKGHTSNDGKKSIITYNVLAEENIEVRTHLTFVNKLHPQHHKDTTPLIKLKEFDMVNGFILDYMHAICLGTVRRLLNFWLKADSNFRIKPVYRNIVARRMVEVGKYFPKEFHRRPRTTLELDRFKASEFRTIILYIGFAIFKGMLPREMYQHFLLLFCSCRIVANNYDDQLSKKASEMIRKFVQQSHERYPSHEPVHNTHSLTHLIEQLINTNMRLDDVSCFSFENYLGKLKRSIRGYYKPFEQACKRIYEKQDYLPYYSTQHNNIAFQTITTVKGVTTQIKFQNFYLSSEDENNSYIILRCMKVMKIRKIICKNDNSVFLSGSVYQKNVNAFEHPIPSSLLHIYKVDGLSAFQFTVTLQDVFTKCLLFSVEDDIFAVGLLHAQVREYCNTLFVNIIID